MERKTMMETILLPTRETNYAVLIRDAATGHVALVDAPEAAPIIAALDQRGWRLDTILITHRHGDHIEGIPDLVAKYGAKVIAPALAEAAIPQADRFVKEGDRIELGGLIADVWDIPGHCTDHIGYHFAKDAVFFAGDTLFTMGCGRVLGSTMEALYASLQRIAALPGDTQVYCGHEYSLANAQFCAAMAPENTAIAARLRDIEARIAAGKPCVPTTLRDERETNLFLFAPDLARFTALREAKNRF
jgi:hydroxyacylglutathione hydrolase